MPIPPMSYAAGVAKPVGQEMVKSTQRLLWLQHPETQALRFSMLDTREVMLRSAEQAAASGNNSRAVELLQQSHAVNILIQNLQ